MGFIVTNLETSSRVVVRFYNKRGTAEQWIKEGKQAAAMTVTTVIRKLRFDRAFEMTPSAATEPRSVARAPDASRCYTDCGGQDDPKTAVTPTGPLRRADAMPGRSEAAGRAGLGIRDQVRRLPGARHQERWAAFGSCPAMGMISRPGFRP